MTTEPDFLTYGQAAAIMGVSTRTIARLAADGTLTVYRFSPQVVRTTRADLDALAARTAEGGKR